MPAIALQLWSVREEQKQDFDATTAAVAAIGYAGVELAGYGNLDAQGAARALKSAGLAVAGMHVGHSALRANLEQVATEAHILGAPNVTCPFISPLLMQTATACQRLGEELGRIGSVLRDYGIRFSYHNHAHELAVVEGRTALDWIFSAAAPRDLAAEIDVYWVQQGGQNPAAVIRRFGARCPLIHLKDEQQLGLGPVDFPEVFSAIDAVGSAEWLIVEQEKFTAPPIESAAANFQQLKRWGRA